MLVIQSCIRVCIAPVLASLGHHNLDGTTAISEDIWQQLVTNGQSMMPMPSIIRLVWLFRCHEPTDIAYNITKLCCTSIYPSPLSRS
ncbi:hypothetical protein BGY98DRAFT_1005178, partial [Russula aff. rugulosa BPL654]